MPARGVRSESKYHAREWNELIRCTLLARAVYYFCVWRRERWTHGLHLDLYPDYLIAAPRMNATVYAVSDPPGLHLISDLGQCEKTICVDKVENILHLLTVC